MNTQIHDLSLGNSLAGLQHGKTVGLVSDPFMRPTSMQAMGVPHGSAPGPKVVHSIAGLQMGDQVVELKATRDVQTPVIGDLRSLREEERSMADPITDYAFAEANTLLTFAHLVFGDDLPRTLLAPDGEGGIRIEWFRENRNVRVIIPSRPERRAYVYQLIGEDPRIKPFSQSSVVQTLRSVILRP